MKFLLSGHKIIFKAQQIRIKLFLQIGQCAFCKDFKILTNRFDGREFDFCPVFLKNAGNFVLQIRQPGLPQLFRIVRHAGVQGVLG